MPECHKCPHDGKRRRACLTCSVSLENRNGKNVVSVDAISGTRFEPRVRPDMAAAIDGPEDESEWAEKHARFSSFIGRLFQLSPKALLVVQARYQAMRSIDGRPTFGEIGQRIGCSKQAVYKLIEEVREAIPALSAMFSGLDSAGKRRRQAASPLAPESASAPVPACEV